MMFERFCDDRTPNSQRGIAVRRRRYGSPTRIKDILRGSAERQSSCEMLASDLNFRLRVRRIVPNRHTCFATSCTKDTRSPNASRRPNVVEFREASGLRRVHRRFWLDGGGRVELRRNSAARCAAAHSAALRLEYCPRTALFPPRPRIDPHFPSKTVTLSLSRFDVAMSSLSSPFKSATARRHAPFPAG